MPIARGYLVTGLLVVAVPANDAGQAWGGHSSRSTICDVTPNAADHWQAGGCWADAMRHPEVGTRRPRPKGGVLEIESSGLLMRMSLSHSCEYNPRRAFVNPRAIVTPSFSPLFSASPVSPPARRRLIVLASGLTIESVIPVRSDFSHSNSRKTFSPLRLPHLLRLRQRAGPARGKPSPPAEK